jgi:hypothetical protein
VAEATSEEQVSRRRRQDTCVRADRQIDGRAPDLFADTEEEAPVSQRPRYGQEDDRSYPPTC